MLTRQPAWRRNQLLRLPTATLKDMVADAETPGVSDEVRADAAEARKILARRHTREVTSPTTNPAIAILLNEHEQLVTLVARAEAVQNAVKFNPLLTTDTSCPAVCKALENLRRVEDEYMSAVSRVRDEAHSARYRLRGTIQSRGGE